MWKLYAAVIAVLIVGLTWGMAHVGATPVVACGEREAVLNVLAKNGEERIGVGATSNGQGVVEVFRNAEGTAWTILLTLSEGPDVACLVSHGDAWLDLTPEPKGPQT